MNLMGVVYIMICSFFSLDPHIDSVIGPLGLPHMSVLRLLLIWAIVRPYRSIPITSDLTVVSATMLLLFINLKSIFVPLPDQSIRFQC